MLFFALIGYSNNVTIKVINLSNDTIRAIINVSDNVGSSNSNSLIFQEILPKKEYSTTFKVDKYSVLTGYAIFNRGGKSKENHRVIVKKNDLFSFIVSHPEDGNTKNLTDLVNSGKILEYDQSKFLDNDNTPKPIEALFSQYLGGLVAYIDSSGKIIPKHTISPTDLGTKIKITFGSATSSREINFISQNTQNIKSNIPTIAQLGVNWDNSSLYNVKIEYSRIGVIDYQTNGINLSQAFNKINKDELYNIGYLKAKYPELKIRQINQAYGFEAVYIEVNQGNNIGMSNEINASTFFTNKGNFSISNKSLDKKVFGNSYLGYWFTSTAPDLTGSLNYALALYYSVTNNTFVVKTEDDVINEYQEIRKSNKSLPDLKTKKEITDYFKNQIEQFKNLNPEFKSDKSLQVTKLETTDPINKLSDIELRSSYDILKQKNIGIPDTFDADAAKLYLKLLQENTTIKIE